MAGALTAMGAVIGVGIPSPVRSALGFGVLVAIGGLEIAGHADRLPQDRRLVPQTILAADTVTGPLQFGFEMGTGVRTFAPSALPLGLAVIALLWSPNAVEGLAMGAGFALGRALAIPARRPEPEQWDRRMSEAKSAIRLILIAAYALILVEILHH
jgi:hypothetical protein